MPRRRSRLDWYAWYPEDFAGDELVRLMTPAARGAYRELLDHSWRVGPISDPERCLRAWGWEPALWEAEIRCCWRLEDEGWIQGRLESERGEALVQVEKCSAGGHASRARMTEAQRREAARLAALERWRKARNAKSDAKVVSTDANLMHTRCTPDANSPPPPPPSPSETTPNPRKRGHGGKLSHWHAVKLARFPQLLEGRYAELLPDWEAHLEERLPRAYTQTGATRVLGQIAAMTPDRLAAAIENSASGNYQKLVEPHVNGNGQVRQTTARERLEAILAESAALPDREPPRDVEDFLQR